MNIEKIKELPWPSRRENLKGFQFSIYCEPMVGSGERICCSSVVVTANEFLISRVPNFHKFCELFGKEKSNALLYFTQTVEEILSVQLKEEQTLKFISENKRLPSKEDEKENLHLVEPIFTGFYFGELRACAGNTLQEMVDSCHLMNACLFGKTQLNSGDYDAPKEEN